MSDLGLLQERIGLPITPLVEPSPKFDGDGDVTMQLDYRPKSVMETSAGMGLVRSWLANSGFSEIQVESCSARASRSGPPSVEAVVVLGENPNACGKEFGTVRVRMTQPLRSG